MSITKGEENIPNSYEEIFNDAKKKLEAVADVNFLDEITDSEQNDNNASVPFPYGGNRRKDYGQDC